MIRKGNRLYTPNLVPGQKVYGEKLVRINGIEYREWNPHRSKLAAAILKGMKVNLNKDMTVLYLGAASGTTVSHVSDIVKKVYAVEFAYRPMRDLILLAKTRKNLMPILADASKPELYKDIDKPDFIYQDIAQPNQVEIFVKNMKYFDAPEGLLMVKARSIDVKADPKDVFKNVERKLIFKIEDKKRLEPYEKDHMAFLVKNI